MTESAFDSARFRQVLGHFPTGVCVVAGHHEDQPVGLAIGSFFSVSLEPPLVGFCVGHGSSSWPKLRDNGQFCVSVLGADQEAVSRVFASKEPDKFAAIGWERSPLGEPRITGALAWMDCTLFDVHGEGDHDIVVGQVHDLGVAHEGTPLIFFRGGYTSLS
jgi:flavin reductase (DIM6/NTAB) family NADH-FMN oxidoreductase RutF